jgi:Probable sensor domain DACNV
MKREAYAAARTVSPKLHAYFSSRREEAAGGGGHQLAAVPDAETIETLIDAAFWASLRREEGYEPRISLAYLSPREAEQPVLFERPLSLDPAVLTRVSPAVERPGIHLGVWHDSEGLCVWGAARAVPILCFVLEVAAPGLLVIKHHSGEVSRKFVNVAVLEGDQIKFVDKRVLGRPQAPALLKALLRLDSPTSGVQSAITLLQLAVAMREHRRGGSLLLVPVGTESWRESIVQPMLYAVSPPFSELACLNPETPEPIDHRVWQEAIAPAVGAIGGLTAVDGAVVLNSRYELLGFGAKMARRKGWPRVEQVLLTEPVEGNLPAVMHLDQIGGTRHLSAAQFVHDQRDTVALVASRDGRFTVFEWSPRDSIVHAHRIETLLI